MFYRKINNDEDNFSNYRFFLVYDVCVNNLGVIYI